MDCVDEREVPGDLTFNDARVQRVVGEFDNCGVRTDNLMVHCFIQTLRACEKEGSSWDRYRAFHNSYFKNFANRQITFDVIGYEKLEEMMDEIVESEGRIEVPVYR